MPTEPRIIIANDRGQLTLPKADRDILGTRAFIYTFTDNTIVLTPLQTREDFLRELDEAEADWRKHGGYSLKEMRKRHGV